MKTLFLFLSLTLTAWGHTLYLLFEVGETIPLMEVMKKADENGDDYVIFADGVARTLLGDHPKLISLELEEKIDRSWKRDALLSKVSIEKILAATEADKVVTGVHFHFYGQLLQAFEAQGAQTYAFWDNINTDGSDPYFQSAKYVADHVQTLLVPSYSFLKKYPSAEVVGQPALEMIPNPMPIPPTDLPLTHPLIVWAGGYGEEYNVALRKFLNEIEILPNAMVILTYHPKYEGVVEKEMLREFPYPNVFIYDTKQLPSFHAIAHADLVICHQSTAGLQAALGGKHVVYFTPPGQKYTNLLIESGIAPQLTSLKELKMEETSSQDILDVLQVPRNGTDRIYSHLHR